MLCMIHILIAYSSLCSCYTFYYCLLFGGFSHPLIGNVFVQALVEGGEELISPGGNADALSNSTGMSKCRSQGCDKIPNPRTPFCWDHWSAARQCQHVGCEKLSQGNTRLCIAHGGGRRCTHPGCNKGARDRFFCAAHGGGKRCSMAGCGKAAVGGSDLCTAHGGGKRCQVV